MESQTLLDVLLARENSIHEQGPLIVLLSHVHKRCVPNGDDGRRKDFTNFDVPHSCRGLSYDETKTLSARRNSARAQLQNARARLAFSRTSARIGLPDWVKLVAHLLML